MPATQRNTFPTAADNSTTSGSSLVAEPARTKRKVSRQGFAENRPSRFIRCRRGAAAEPGSTRAYLHTALAGGVARGLAVLGLTLLFVGLFQFTDTNAPGIPIRFYRAVSP